jgi:cytochrome c-type biogenesis protein CcmH
MTRAVACALALLLLAAPASASAACPQTSVPDIEDEVMCLQCGVPLNVAEEAPSAKRQRAFIQQQVDQCKSKDEIKAQLVAQFGDRVLAEPKGDSAWLVPALGIAAGLMAVTLAAYRWRRGRAQAAQPQPVAAGDAARLNADLERYDD